MAGKAQIHQVSGATDATTHSYSDEEKVAFADYINNALKKDPDCAPKLPININDMSLFAAVHDGILLCKLINDAVPETIDERVINKKKISIPSELQKIKHWSSIQPELLAVMLSISVIKISWMRRKLI